MDHRGQEEIALHRWAVIAEAAGDRLTPGSGERWSAGSPPAPTPTRTARPGRIRGARSTAGCAPGARAGWPR